MAEDTKISWADDTFNPWEGCQSTGSPACAHCYAEARNLRYAPKGSVVAPNWGANAPRRRTSASNWARPLKWNEQQAAAEREAWLAGQQMPPARFVFCASLADVFDNAVDRRWRCDLFDLIRKTPYLSWLLLTKRPGNIVKLFRETDPVDQMATLWPRNAAIGFTAVTQKEMDRDSKHALAAFHAMRAPFLFWSGEPLMEAVCIPDELLALGPRFWAITGAESDQGKHKARPSHPDWFRSARDQCAAAGVAYQHKQNGEFLDIEHIGEAWNSLPDRTRSDQQFVLGKAMVRVGKKAAGRLLDGVEHNARPQVRR